MRQDNSVMKNDGSPIFPGLANEHNKTTLKSFFSPVFLPYSEVDISLRFLEEGRLPAYRGATLRGGFGYNLKKTVCHVSSNRCSECILRNNCAYSYIFEGVAPEEREIMRLYPYVPQPFVILIECKTKTAILRDDIWNFGLRLFGKAVEYFPYIAYSLIRLGEEGLGKDRIKFIVESIKHSNKEEILYQNGNSHIASLPKQYFKEQSFSENLNKVTLNFVTPLRLRVDGKDVNDISFIDIIRSAARRLTILSYFYGNPVEKPLITAEMFELANQIKTEQNNTQFFSFQRYSGRQKRKMNIGGLTGNMTFTGPVTNFIPLLKMAEITNIGKATSFGFGRIKINFEGVSNAS